ncbi:MAG TPA: lipid IV(A) 3-deoxy-D-manno-octulosonic acid transferase [Gammaproteobacteria bacterium]
MRLWSIAAYLLLPYAVVGLIWRGLRYPAYWRRWPERFGFMRPVRGERVVWVHAVSVGEVRSSAPLVRAIADRLPRHRILVTTMTPTGSEQVAKLFGERVLHRYLPYDTPDAVARFLDRIRPELAIIAETEFWPNLFHACVRRGIPLHIVNARMSLSSFRAYLLAGRAVRSMFASADLICAQTSLDAQRLRNLGVDDRLLTVTGNLKFDVEPPATVAEEARQLRRQWGESRPVLIAASTHQGEETRILTAFADLRQRYRDLLLVLVPRHPERFSTVARLCRRRGFTAARRSMHSGDLPAAVSVVVGDTMGELHRLYAASDVAIIGGSFVRHGGQNPLEACMVSVPVIFGPHMFHFEEISALTLERGAGRQVPDAAALVDAVALYLDQPELRRAAGRSARALIEDNHGSLEATLAAMSRQLASTAAAAGRVEDAADSPA